MNPAAYLEMAATESAHWWFVGRRSILSRTIAGLGLPEAAKILEVGCGTGGNLEMLARFGALSGLEMDGGARATAEEKTGRRFDIRPGSCPDEIGFHGERFDLICLFDVLEHIGPDVETLKALGPLLAKGGRILVTVPAYQWLWGAHDEFLHHKRRYSMGRLRAAVEAAGLRPTRLSHFNMFLFPLAAIVRLKERWLGSGSASGGSIPSAPINALFRVVFGAERFLLDHFDLPFGVSLLCICKAADDA